MARKKVTPEEEIVNTAVEGTALGSVPAGSVLHDEAGADTGDIPAELPEGDLSAEETAEQSETLPAMEAAEAKPFGLSAAEKTASQGENDTVEKRAEETELHEETSEFLEAAEDLHSNLPASAPHGSEADGADWGFEEPVTEEAAAEPAEDEYLADGNSEMPDAPEEKSVMLAYASVYGHTENAANVLAAKLCERGVTVRMFDTSVIPANHILSAAFRSSHLIFAATTYNNGVFVMMENLLHDIVNHNLQNRKIAVIENGTWAPTSGKLMREMLSALKKCEFIGENVTLRSSLAESQLAELDALADAIAADIKTC